jgi:5-methyltetrahydrofolate--homocysteine methyltransferase
MNIIFERLKQKKILISDGAWGTMLQSKGLKAGECPEEWNISHPDVVKSIAAEYIKAGAEIVLTNSFGGSEFKLSGFGYENRTKNINLAAAQLSREAAGDNVLVFGSVGPSGQLLTPLGTKTEEQMIENFRIQIKGLSEGGADAILIETMIDVGEAIAAVKAARDVCNLPVAGRRDQYQEFSCSFYYQLRWHSGILENLF